LAAGCLALFLLAGTVVADGSAQAATVRYQRESLKAFEGQLSAGQIETAVFNKKAHSLHLLLRDGRHVRVSYPSHEEPQLAAKLEAKGISVQVEKTKKPAKAVHHKLRYIAGGIVIVVIVVVAAVLFIDRRRKLNEAGGGAHPASSSGDTA
jgi:hypothetical protein